MCANVIDAIVCVNRLLFLLLLLQSLSFATTVNVFRALVLNSFQLNCIRLNAAKLNSAQLWQVCTAVCNKSKMTNTWRRRPYVAMPVCCCVCMLTTTTKHCFTKTLQQNPQQQQQWNNKNYRNNAKSANSAIIIVAKTTTTTTTTCSQLPKWLNNRKHQTNSAVHSATRQATRWLPV